MFAEVICKKMVFYLLHQISLHSKLNVLRKRNGKALSFLSANLLHFFLSQFFQDDLKFIQQELLKALVPGG